MLSMQQLARATATRVVNLHMNLILLLVIAISSAEAPAGDSVTMIQVADLRAESMLAKQKGLVLVIEFSADDCAYCRKLEDLFLLPMQRNAEYGDKILLRAVSLSDFDSLIDFDGRQVTTNQFAAQYDVTLTPTLVFLNADGVEMSEKLVGIWSEDFYGGFIDDRIDEAQEKL
jgi:thioredoxin-related protein